MTLLVLFFLLLSSPSNADYVGYRPPDSKTSSADSYRVLYEDLGENFGGRSESAIEYPIELRVPSVKIGESATSLCVVESFLHVRDVENIVKIHPVVNDNDRVVRMMIIGCSKPYQKSGYWDCLKVETLCQDDPQIVYSWGPGAPDVPIPPGVGFEVGSSTLLKYLVLEIDYESADKASNGLVPSSFTDDSGFALTISRATMHFKAGSYVFIGSGVNQDNIDVACTFSHENSIFPFGFAMIGDESIETVSAFRVQNSDGILKWTSIGRGNPGWPQVFYPMEHILQIHNGDMLAIRCSRNYNYFLRAPPSSASSDSGKNSADSDAANNAQNYNEDESQCSLTFLFFTLVENRNTFLLCTQPGHPSLFSSIPRDYDELVKEKTNIILDSVYSKDVLRYEQLIQSQKSELQRMGHVAQDAGLQLGSDDLDDNDNSIISHIDKPNEQVSQDVKQVIYDNHWPPSTVALKQQGIVELGFDPSLYGDITGVGTLTNGSIVFVHRANREHTHMSFNDAHFFRGDQRTISEDVVVILDSQTGQVLSSFGSGLFVLPQGLYVDHEDYVYVTDIAKHQVIKFSLINVKQPMLLMGTSREPGNDQTHFCQPTGVSVSSNSNKKNSYIFVADGFCNSRIVKFNANGKYKSEMSLNDKKDNIGINQHVEVSSVTTCDSLSLVCASSNTHGLIHCFNIETGDSVRVIHSPTIFGTHISAITYSDSGSLFYVLTAPSSKNIKTEAFSVDINTEKLMQSFSPDQSFGFKTSTYDIAASPENQYIYVADQSSKKLHKFIQMEQSFLARGVAQGKSSRLVDGASGDGSNSGVSKFDDSFYSSLAILLLIAIPLTIVVTATVVSRSRSKSHPINDHKKFVTWSTKKGYDKATMREKPASGKSSSSNGMINGILGGGKKGFHRLPSVDSDREADRLTDSEAEEYTGPQVM